MNKKVAAPSIQLTQQEIERTITEALTQLSAKMQQEAGTLSEKFTQEVNTMVRDLSDKIKTELQDLGKQTRTVSIEELQGGARADDGKVYAFQLEDLPGVYKEGKKKRKEKQKHPTPRDKEHNKDLPDFWRHNFDYGESPYMNIGFIEKITDKPPFKKKKVKKSNDK